ncbi:3-deoxy-manno-octulosonate cytidylyltransferase [Lysobacter pythonis]|uniref:3-deoxy-manno-octulosonate cytidylyltransferase n=1 Tax=Solilutibacter pythonis TaxID=2483112 RepID=A0A3M2HYS7_9GAMM|nr:3-deoxy-manno-octulosonate cytidylyltransferase [Lysobacter pythonis]RMH94891.1 3-deoxy-manno-octulosonate cytidylyltransferase [Lysobacter pythonis]
MTDFVVAIPARFAASRLPGKPLRPIGGQPLVWHVAQRALAAGAREVWVAADDPRILDAVRGEGIRVAMTSPDHASGTDRLAELADIAGWADDTIIVNLQGDEPFAPAAGIRAVAGLLERADCEMATLAAPVTDRETVFDPNAVKVVTDAYQRALYFSRAPVPWHRDAFSIEGHVLDENPWLRHIGIYAYRAGFLRRFAALPPGRLERIEKLEQLRVMEAGFRIAVALTPEAFPPGVDTPEDLARAEARWKSSRP